MILTPVEIEVFGANPAAETIEAFRYRTERVQKLLAQLYPQPKRRQRKPRQPAPDGLKTAAQAAAKLGCSIKTLNGYVAAGTLKYIAIGHGTRRQRKMFTDVDINEFIANQTRKDSPCPSIRTETADRRTGISTSKLKVIGFMEARNRRRNAKPKP
jgi:hypothetical protein